MRVRCLQSFLLLAMGCQSHSVLSLGTRPVDTMDDVDAMDDDPVDDDPMDDVDPMDDDTTPAPEVEPMDASTEPSVGPAPVPTLELDASVEPGPDPEPVPLHRYSFDGSGTVAVDSASGADGLILGDVTLTGTGVLELDGVDDYVELPQRLVSGLDGVTLMLWAAVHSDVCWQRFFDFGNDVIVDGVSEGDTAIYLSPRGCTEIEGPSAYLQFRRNLGGDVFVREYLSARTSQFVELDVQRQFAMVVDSQAVLLYLYIDGVEQARRSLVAADGGVTFGLSDVVDVNCWIGRSQYTVDAFLSATMSEFRIYDGALGPDSVLAAFEAGPDTLP